MLKVKLKRQLSVSYTDPFTGHFTNDDPSSYTGFERICRENRLAEEHPNTGYATSILAKRMQYGSPCRPCSFFYLKKDDDENSNAESLSIPTAIAAY